MASQSFIDLSGLQHYDGKIREVIAGSYVNLTGAQTISGAKTFTASPTISMSQPIALLTNPNLTKGTNPSSNTYGNIMFQDKTSTVNMVKRAGSLDFGVNTSGQTEVSMRAFDWGQETNTNGAISIYYPKSGTPYTAAPTPASSDNSTKIATTAFVKAQNYLTSHQSLANYVTLNTAQTITAAKTFSATPVLNQVGLNMTVKDTNAETTRTDSVISANSSNTTYGINVMFGANSNTIVGAGEGKNSQMSALAGTSSENIYLVADGNIYLKPNANTYANAKTFTFTAGGNIEVHDPVYERGVSETAITRELLDIKDKNGVRYSLLESGVAADKSSYMGMFAYKTTATSGNNIGGIRIGCDSSGNVYTQAPTPAVADNSTKIATTAWARTATGNFACNAATATTATTATTANSIGTNGNPSTATKMYYTVGQPAIGTAAGNAYKGSSNNATLLSFPENGTVSTESTANIQNLRMMWASSTSYFTDIFVSPNNHYIWHRDVMNGTAFGWRRLVEEDVTGITAPTWNISISGTAAKATQDGSGNNIVNTYATKSELNDITSVTNAQIDTLFA